MTVNLTKRVVMKDEKGKPQKDAKGNLILRYCPAVESNKPGHFKANHVWVNKKEENHPEGTYYIEWRENGKRIRKAVGKDVTEARAELLKQEKKLGAQSVGLQVVDPKASAKDEAHSLRGAVDAFIEELKLRNMKHRSVNAYQNALNYFLESCKNDLLEDIERLDLLKYCAFLRSGGKTKAGRIIKKQSDRSVANKFEIVVSFLKSRGIKTSGHGGLIKKEDWPKYVEEEPEIYEEEELEILFKACDDEERMWYEFFLMTGMREQEVMYTYWSNISFATGIVSMKHKPDRGWTPKAYKERSIPMPDKLIESLKVWKTKSNPACNLVFPTAGCNPKFDFLDCLKAVAKRAGLDPEKFWLHKFRATFATTNLWAAVDLRTVQMWLGHTDIQSTMRYLKPARDKAVRDKMNANPMFAA